MYDVDREIVETMVRYGGSFVRHLGEACRFADSVNIERIKKAFPEYWEQYAMMAGVIKAQEGKL